MISRWGAGVYGAGEMRVGLVVALGLGVIGAGCKPNPMQRIEALRAALVADDLRAIEEVTGAFPECTEEVAPVATPPGKAGPRDAGCLTEIANALGSKEGFRPSPPDHAAAATAALVIARDGRGDYMVHANGWLADIREGKGTGHDALRLAVARKMAEAAPTVGRKIYEEDEAKAAMAAVASAVPGACPTYFLLGASEGRAALPTELTADHSACVHQDLKRRDGPGGIYGTGTFRATEGALALWRDAERALRMGLPNAHPKVKANIEKKLAVIEEATQKIETKRVESKLTMDAANFMSDVHAMAGVPIDDAGVRDAGGDAAAGDAGVGRGDGASGDGGAEADAGATAD